MLAIDILILIAVLIETASTDSGYSDLLGIPDYLDVLVNPRKSTNNIREKFLKDKKQRRILQDFRKLFTNNTINIDGISHLEITPDWKKAQDIENDYKSLIRMINVKYVYQKDSHWRTWRQIKDSQGKKQIICYKCQNKILSNCSDCATRGVWIIEDAMPPCPYELFSVVNNNEVCASNYTQLSEELKECPSVIKYADLTKSCNNPIITRWRFTENYKVSRGYWFSIICGGRRAYCEIITLYQIRPEYVIFRIVNATNKDIIYSRVMRENKRNYACINDCGIIDLKTYRVTKNKEKSTILNLLQTMPRKSKRDSSKTYKKRFYFDSSDRNSLENDDKRIENPEIISRNKLYAALTNNAKSNIQQSNNKTERHLNASTLVATRNSSISVANQWLKTAEGYFIQKMTLMKTTTQSICRRLAKKKRKDEANTFQDYYEDIEQTDVLCKDPDNPH